jgi:hypothetical protein
MSAVNVKRMVAVGMPSVLLMHPAVVTFEALWLVCGSRRLVESKTSSVSTHNPV